MTTTSHDHYDTAFSELEQQARVSAAALDSPEAIEAFRLEWLGRKQGRLKTLSEPLAESRSRRRRRRF